MTLEEGFEDQIPRARNVIIANATPGEGGPSPLKAVDILERIANSSDHWPRRVGGCLMVPDSNDNTQVDIWDKNGPARLFSWLKSEFQEVVWYTGKNLLTKEEFYYYVRSHVRRHESIELTPHFPRFDDKNPPSYYYACPHEAWNYAKADGSKLTELLQMFNPATLEDYDLLKAMFLTLLWGGPPGDRPIFVITSDFGSGSGKSTVAYAAADLCCGYMDMQPNEDLTALKNRLLSPLGRSRRVAILDNVSAVKFQWELLESCVTQPEVTGKQMYVGEGTRPNTLIWFMTLNGISLGRDLSQRAVVIKVDKPKYATGWIKSLRTLVKSNRMAIWQDILKLLSSPSQKMEGASRWASWEQGVLSKIPNPDTLMNVIVDRQGAADDDEEEAGLIKDVLYRKLDDVNVDADVVYLRVPKHLIAQWVCEALGKKLTTIGASRRVTRHIQSGYIPELSEDPSHGKVRCFIWRGIKAIEDSPSFLDPALWGGQGYSS